MPDDFFIHTPPPVATKPRSGLRGILWTLLLVLALVATLAGWLAWTGRLDLETGTAEPVAVPDAATPSPTMPLVTTTTAPPSALPGAAATLALPTGALDQRLAMLEQRLSQLDLRAEAAAGNATRAEGLLIAFAVRRALERGTPLGELGDQLRLRFEAAQPAAVRVVLEAAAQPLTLDQLTSQLDALAPELTGVPQSESGWQRAQRELGSMFTIRRGTADHGDPDDALARARQLLRSGQIETARQVVERLPGSAAARDWLAAANRYDSAQRALDLIETAALKEPRELRDDAGMPVQQPGI